MGSVFVSSVRGMEARFMVPSGGQSKEGRMAIPCPASTWKRISSTVEQTFSIFGANPQPAQMDFTISGPL